MKKTMMILVMAAAAIACEKQTIEPTAPSYSSDPCECATITQVEEVTDTINDMHYWEYELTNDCSGIQEVVMTYYEPMNSDYVIPVFGNKICK